MTIRHRTSRQPVRSYAVACGLVFLAGLAGAQEPGANAELDQLQKTKAQYDAQKAMYEAEPASTTPKQRQRKPATATCQRSSRAR